MDVITTHITVITSYSVVTASLLPFYTLYQIWKIEVVFTYPETLMSGLAAS